MWECHQYSDSGRNYSLLIVNVAGTLIWDVTQKSAEIIVNAGRLSWDVAQALTVAESTA